jgi:predicted ArsR family transcriptional regulator
MHGTKTEILALLKRADGSTVDDLASALGLAPMTVRQHLTALERDALVAAAEVRRPTGRPHFVYRLTEDGHRSVSVGYDRMLALLIEQAGHTDAADVADATPAERRHRLIRRAALALAERHRSEIQALAGATQMERLVAILRSYGGFSDWHEAPGGFEVRDFACMYRTCAGEVGSCAWHEAFLVAVLETDVRVPDDSSGCVASCRYIIPTRAAASATNRG